MPDPPPPDAKTPRLRWTPELHGRFVDAVYRLGGPEKATPRALMQAMRDDNLSIYHIKVRLSAYHYLLS